MSEQKKRPTLVPFQVGDKTYRIRFRYTDNRADAVIHRLKLALQCVVEIRNGDDWISVLPGETPFFPFSNAPDPASKPKYYSRGAYDDAIRRRNGVYEGQKFMPRILSKQHARKLALADALRDIPREDRYVFWEHFFRGTKSGPGPSPMRKMGPKEAVA